MIDTSKLVVGNVYSYKELCELTGAEYQRGSGKNRQLDGYGEFGFHRFFDFEKIGYGKFLITKILESPLKIFDRRKFGNARGVMHISEECFKIYDEYIAHNAGVYKIENDQSVYIGSTTRTLTKRFSEHYHNRGNNHNKTKEVLNNGGDFVCLQSFPLGTDEKIIRDCEEKYINQYKNGNKKLLNNYKPAIMTRDVNKKKKKPQYKTIKIPQIYYDDIQDILKKSGYTILDKIVFYQQQANDNENSETN